MPERRSRAIGGTDDLNIVEKIIHPRYLGVLERERLHDLRRSGLSIRAIASAMNRAPSTISRELNRNTVSTRSYLPYAAHRLSVTRRARPRKPKLVANERLRAYVQAKLKTKWSPQQISHWLIKDFPGAEGMRVSPETIYQGRSTRRSSSMRAGNSPASSGSRTVPWIGGRDCGSARSVRIWSVTFDTSSRETSSP